MDTSQVRHEWRILLLCVNKLRPGASYSCVWITFIITGSGRRGTGLLDTCGGHVVFINEFVLNTMRGGHHPPGRPKHRPVPQRCEARVRACAFALARPPAAPRDSTVGGQREWLPRPTSLVLLTHPPRAATPHSTISASVTATWGSRRWHESAARVVMGNGDATHCTRSPPTLCNISAERITAPAKISSLRNLLVARLPNLHHPHQPR